MQTRFVRIAVVLGALWMAGCDAKPSASSAPAAPPQPSDASLLARMPLGRVLSSDASGRARMIAGASAPASLMPAAMPSEAAARLQLTRHVHQLGLRADVVKNAQLRASQRLPAGAELVQFEQRAHDIEVFGARAAVLLDAHKNLVSLSSNLSPVADGKLKPPRFGMPAEQALARAYAHKTGRQLPQGAARATRTNGPWNDFAVETEAHAPEVVEASVKKVLFPERGGQKLTAAYQVEMLTRAGDGDATNRAFGSVIAADSGKVLWSASLTADDSFHYRVWADSRGVPTDGPLVDATPHPSGKPDKVLPGYASPTLITMEGFNTNPDGRPDPWLSPSDTVTSGNNVQAYSDRDNYTDDAGVPHDDGFTEGSDLRAEVTSANTFDRTYDLEQAPDSSPEQIKAAITQLFYVNNWLHDYWYDSGFDEASHNAQAVNYGRGGVEGDPVRAEAQDSANSGIANNANMSTFSDGRSPRMQMYVWTGLPKRTLELDPALTFDDGLGASAFGPQTFDLSADKLELVLADDGSTELPAAGGGSGTGTTSDACQPPSNVQGKLAVIDRGACTFVVKVHNAQDAGARAVLVLDNAPGHVPPSPSSADKTITVPLLSLSYEDGMKLKGALDGHVIATAFKRDVETQRDGTIDNTVVAHEWGHYLHHRLVFCGSQSCDGMSEGWGDFDALMLVIKADDVFPGKVYPLAQYATGGLGPNSTYFGIRRAPYSVDMDKNPFTFQHIRKSAKLPTGVPLAPTSVDMSEVHNVGEIWAETLFEAYVNVIEAGRKAGRSFEETKRRMADYVVAGMKAAPAEPTFTEQRDAILAGVYAMGQGDRSRMDDFEALARGFAKRGLGAGAVAPPAVSETLDEAVESFDYKGDLQVSELALDDSKHSCDHDGVLDVGESGALELKVWNGGWLPLTQPKLRVASSDARITFDGGGEVEVPALEPFQSAELSLGVTVGRGLTQRSLMPLTITASDPDSFKPTADLSFSVLYNYDDRPKSAAVDDVESEHTTWVVSPDTYAEVWSRDGDARNHWWHAADTGAPTDESLVSPELVVSNDNPLVISFSHRYSFEVGPPTPTATEDVAFDGAVLEVSDDGGSTWKDISEYGDPGYDQTIFSTASWNDPDEPDSNALAGRKAWGGQSPGYPSYTRITIDAGDKLKGKTIQLRFRVGTDAGTGAAGWDIDDIAFGAGATTGLRNTPFSAIRDDAARCGGRYP
jgi:hypothetical protein